jgi:hypothetical protein
MSFTRALRMLSFQLCGYPGTSPPGDSSRTLAPHINTTARRNRVRGAGSEPHYTAASFNPKGDGERDNAIR